MQGSVTDSAREIGMRKRLKMGVEKGGFVMEQTLPSEFGG